MGRAVWLSTSRDRGSFSFLVLGIAFVIYWDITVIAPAYYPDVCLAYVVHFGAVAFLTANIALNFYWVITEARNERSYETGQTSPRGWQFCSECQRAFPPSCYHCRICKICSYKRDHHCVFTGTCINYYNISYFMKALWFLLMAATYGVVYNFDYTLKNMGDDVLPQLLFFICPPLAFMVGKVYAYGLLVIIFELLGFIVTMLVLVLIVIQLTATVRGQTRFERKHGISSTNRNAGWKENFKATLGSRWFLIFLCPVLPTPLPEGDPDSNYSYDTTPHNKTE